MNFSIGEVGPHYGTVIYLTIEGENNEAFQTYFDEREITETDFTWYDLQPQMEVVWRSKIMESGETDFLSIRAAIEGQVYKVMPLLASFASIASLAERRVDPPVKTKADHDAHMKRRATKK